MTYPGQSSGWVYQGGFEDSETRPLASLPQHVILGYSLIRAWLPEPWVLTVPAAPILQKANSRHGVVMYLRAEGKSMIGMARVVVVHSASMFHRWVDIDIHNPYTNTTTFGVMDFDYPDYAIDRVEEELARAILLG